MCRYLNMVLGNVTCVSMLVLHKCHLHYVLMLEKQTNQSEIIKSDPMVTANLEMWFGGI